MSRSVVYGDRGVSISPPGHCIRAAAVSSRGKSGPFDRRHLAGYSASDKEFDIRPFCSSSPAIGSKAGNSGSPMRRWGSSCSAIALYLRTLICGSFSSARPSDCRSARHGPQHRRVGGEARPKDVGVPRPHLIADQQAVGAGAVLTGSSTMPRLNSSPFTAPVGMALASCAANRDRSLITAWLRV